MANAELATFGAGCFWCVEAIFQQLRGVFSVTSGYMGGHVQDPSYREVCLGSTGHAEVVQIEFDPGQVSYAKLLEVLWHTHDPTTLNRQGNDRGTQYRSVIFTHSEQQRRIAEDSINLVAKEIWDLPIVTEITDANEFYPAEPYHQNYYRENSSAGYCQLVINPKLEKFSIKFADILKS